MKKPVKRPGTPDIHTLTNEIQGLMGKPAKMSNALDIHSLMNEIYESWKSLCP